MTPEAEANRLALESVSEHNSSMPLVPGQLLKGSVIRVDRRTVWVDVGLAKHAKFFRRECSCKVMILILQRVLTKPCFCVFRRSQVELSSVVETTSDAERTGPNDIHLGDVLHVTLETTETPFGDPAVSIDMPRGPDRHEQTLGELKRAYDKGEEVMGRILNTMNGGYAIGIAGLVGFCPFTLCTLQTASRIGVLQPFIIRRFRLEPYNIILEDIHAHKKVEAFNRPPPKAWSTPKAEPESQAPPPDLTPASQPASTPASVGQDEVEAAEKEARALMRASFTSQLKDKEAEPVAVGRRQVEPDAKL